MTKPTRQHRKAGAAVPGARRASSPQLEAALYLARRMCTDFADSQAARDDMKRDVLETPAELLEDLKQALARAPITRADFLTNATTPKESTP